MTLIIGCGNSDRGDDGAGILVVRRLRQLGLDALEHSGDGLALMELWNIDDEVILVDAMQSGANPGTVSTWDPITHPLCAESYRCSTHAFGPREAIELARALDRLPARIQIYGIEAASFEPGEAPCREVLEAVERVAGEIALTLSASQELDIHPLG
jgi:hydrogenase maturation protease